MSNFVDVITEARSWETVDLPKLAHQAATASLAHLGLDPSAYEISLLACDDVRIATLNAQFRNRPGPTNVLSWPAVDLGSDTAGEPPDISAAPRELGDLALAYETCAREAAAAGLTLEAHLTHLTVHGILHLLGYDHIRDEDAALMQAQETAILAKLGQADPYLARAAPDHGT